MIFRGYLSVLLIAHLYALGDEEALNNAVCQKYHRVTPMVNLVRLTVKSKTFLKRVGAFIPTGEFVNDARRL